MTLISPGSYSGIYPVGGGGGGSSATTVVWGGIGAAPGSWSAAYDPPTIMRTDWHECSDLVGERFEDRQMFTSSWALNFQGCRNHLQVFTKSHPEIQDYATVILPNAIPTLVFSSSESLEIFESWFARYRRFYSGADNLPASLIPVYEGEGGAVGLVSVGDKIWNMNELTRIWGWIVRHCERPVYKLDRYLAFESDKDAAKFKLAYA